LLFYTNPSCQNLFVVSLGLKAGQLESSKIDWKSISKDKVAALSKLFCETGAKAGREAGLTVGRIAVTKIQVIIKLIQV